MSTSDVKNQFVDQSLGQYGWQELTPPGMRITQPIVLYNNLDSVIKFSSLITFKKGLKR